MIYPENAVIQAPLAGHTDLPMRLSARRHGCRYAFTEMIDAGSLVFGNLKTMRLAMRHESEEFLGLQLVGSDPDHLKRAVEIVNTMNVSVLDFNLGCPAPKVERKCEGIAFAMRRPDEAVRAFELIVKTSKIPVTVKTRILDPENPEPTVAFAKRLEEAGAAALTLHGRMMKMFYSGPVAFHVIRSVRESLKIPVIANGGVMEEESYREIREKTTCSRVMIARGALGNPWIFHEVGNPSYTPPNAQELAGEIQRHMKDMVDFYGEELAFRMGRKTLLEYLRGRGYPGSMRASISFLSNWNQFEQLLKEIRNGPSEGYWSFLETNPTAQRRLRP